MGSLTLDDSSLVTHWLEPKARHDTRKYRAKMEALATSGSPEAILVRDRVTKIIANKSYSSPISRLHNAMQTVLSPNPAYIMGNHLIKDEGTFVVLIPLTPNTHDYKLNKPTLIGPITTSQRPVYGLQYPEVVGNVLDGQFRIATDAEVDQFFSSMTYDILEDWYNNHGKIGVVS